VWERIEPVTVLPATTHFHKVIRTGLDRQIGLGWSDFEDEALTPRRQHLEHYDVLTHSPRTRASAAVLEEVPRWSMLQLAAPAPAQGLLRVRSCGSPLFTSQSVLTRPDIAFGTICLKSG